MAIYDPMALAQRLSRWWFAPLRLTTSAAEALRAAPSAPAAATKAWLQQTPVGIRTPGHPLFR
ncbi:MAG TPA: hypothetical protein VIQ99_10800 [Gammaproteobacteria bacterium]